MISTFLLQAQGQTLEAAGIYLGTEFFSHGQCYVAFSRVGNPENIKEIMTTLLLIYTINTLVLIFTLHYNQMLKRPGKSEKKRPSTMKNIVYKSVLV